MPVTVPNCIFLFVLPLLVPVGFGSSQQLVCGNTSSAHGGEGRQGRKGREGRMSVAEEAGCEEDACLCRLQPGVELGCVSTHERRGSTTGSEKKTKMVLQVPKLGSASIWELDHRYVLLTIWTRSVTTLEALSIFVIQSETWRLFRVDEHQFSRPENDPILYGGIPASSPVMSYCFCMFGEGKATSKTIRRLSLLDFWGPYGPAKERLCKKMSNLGKGNASIYQC